MDSLIEIIESNASKYNDSKENLKERFMEVCNKEDEYHKKFIDDDWEGDEEIFVIEDECSKSFIKPKILGCDREIDL